MSDIRHLLKMRKLKSTDTENGVVTTTNANKLHPLLEELQVVRLEGAISALTDTRLKIARARSNTGTVIVGF